MPWRSRPQITLSRAERRVLQRLSRRYSAPFRDVVRAKIILRAAEGKATGTIAEEVGLPRQVVLRWVQRFARERMSGLADRPGRGRPRRGGSRRESIAARARGPSRGG